MSKQRKIHPFVVLHQKAMRYLRRHMGWRSIRAIVDPIMPKYHDTEYRGMKRWR